MKTKLLLLLLLANFSIYAQTNLVSNGDFENWASSSQPDDWSRFFSGLVYQDPDSQNGNSSTKMEITSGTLNFIFTRSNFPIEAGKTYRVTAYHKLVSGSFTNVELSLIDSDIWQTTIKSNIDNTTSASGWRKIEFDYTAASNKNVGIMIYTRGSLNSQVLVDNVSVVEAPSLYTNIPDLNFENKLIELGIDSGSADGKVLTSKIAAVTSLNIYNSAISDLTGIEKFTSLENLSAAKNTLTAVDLSKNTKLTTLDISDNKLTSLNLSSNILLENIYCNKNLLTALDVTNNLKLTNLNCSANQISSLNISLNVLLDHLTVNSNKLTSLNIDSNLALTNLNCAGNQLASLNVNKNLALTSLWCGSNQLTSLNIDLNTALQDLNCGYNQLANLNVTNNTNLLYLVCHENKISSINTTKNILLNQLMVHSNKLTSLDISNNLDLSLLTCHNNEITSVDVSKHPKIYEVVANNNKLTYLNLKNGNNTNFTPFYSNFSGNPDLTCIIVDDAAYSNVKWADLKDAAAVYSNDPCQSYTAIPDINFENALIELGIDSGTADGKVLTSKISTVTDLNVSSKNIFDLTGIQDFTSLAKLHCTNNKLTSLDLSYNTALKFIVVTQNELSSINVSKCSLLEDLLVEQNKLAALDVTQNSRLKTLRCNNNQLVNLNLSENPLLIQVICTDNILETIDVSNNPELSFLWCQRNKLISLDPSKMPKLSTLSCSTNNLETLNVSLNSNLTSLSCDENKLASIDVTNNSKLTLLSISYNPKITTLNLTQNANLTDLRSFGVHGLLSVDFSQNKALKTVDIGGSNLLSLDLSKNTNLIQIRCTNSQNLKSINLKNGNNTNIPTSSLMFMANASLECIQVDNADYSNTNWASLKDNHSTFTEDCASLVYTLIPDPNFEQKLINLNIDKDGKNGKVLTSSISTVKDLNVQLGDIKDLTGIQDFTSLEFLNCQFNLLTTLNVSKNLKLIELYTHGNDLTTLNLSANTSLTTLQANKNKLTDLDLTKNSKLTYVNVMENSLKTLNLKNGNNINFTGALLTKNSTLTCILVDNPSLAASSSVFFKDAAASYSSTCSLGLEDSIFNKVALYPNPTKGEVYITNVSLDKATVYNSLGQLVKSFVLDASNTDNTINLSGLPRGIYYVYLINGDAASAKKVIVE